MDHYTNHPHHTSFSQAPPVTLEMQYQAIYQPIDHNSSLQPIFAEPQLQPAQHQMYGFPPPTGSSMDSGYADDDTNPFEDNAPGPDFKMVYGNDVNAAVPDFESYNYMVNEQQVNDPNFMPVNYATDFTHNFMPMKQEVTVSQSSNTPPLVTDETVSVKSEDGLSDAASPKDITHPRSQLPRQSKTRPDTIRRTATEPSMENHAGSLQRLAIKEGRRGRKRIPHTAVERRYRENLNLHLDNLRHAVPHVQAAQRRRASDVNDPMKPSKCEVLVGALEYIQRLENENKILNQKLSAYHCD
jgi:hypothetical protein